MPYVHFPSIWILDNNYNEINAYINFTPGEARSRSWLYYALLPRHVSPGTQTKIMQKYYILGPAGNPSLSSSCHLRLYTRLLANPDSSKVQHTELLSADFQKKKVEDTRIRKTPVRRRNGSDNASKRQSHPAAVVQSSRKSSAMQTHAALRGRHGVC